MKLEKLVGNRFRGKAFGMWWTAMPLMVRGGYIKQVTNPVSFSSYLPLKE